MNIQSFQSPLEQAHSLLNQAWYALDKGNYVEAQEFADAAHRITRTKFSDHQIDLEILRRLGAVDQIPKKLREIGALLELHGVPEEAVKALRRRAKLELPPNPAAYQTVIRLYNGIGKNAKADQWTRELTELLSSGTSSPQTSFVEQAETKQREPSDSPREKAAAPTPSSSAAKQSQEDNAWKKAMRDSLKALPPLPLNEASKLTSKAPKEQNSNRSSTKTTALTSSPNPTSSHRSQPQNFDTEAEKLRYSSYYANLDPKNSLPPQKISQQSTFKAKAPEESKAPAPSSLVVKSDTASSRYPQFSHMICGKETWEKYIGKVDDEPPLPPLIKDILEGSCPFSSVFFNKPSVEKTHHLLLIPGTINGKSLTMERFNEIFEKTLLGNRKVEIGDLNWMRISEKLDYKDSAPYLRTHWVLITKTTKSYVEIYNSNKKIKTHDNYKEAYLLEVLTYLSMRYIVSGQCGFSDGQQILCREHPNSLRETFSVRGGIDPESERIFVDYKETGFIDSRSLAVRRFS